MEAGAATDEQMRVRVLALLLPLFACGDDAREEPRDADTLQDASSPDDAALDGRDDGALHDADGGVVDGGGGTHSEDAAVDGRVEAPDLLDRSGSRLRARRIWSGDHAVATVDVEDAQLDVPCMFRRAPDGAMYCMPLTGETYAAQPPQYADASCSTGAIVYSDGCGAPGAFHALTRVGCVATTRVYHVQESSATTWYSQEGDACVAHALLPGQRLWTFGAELQPQQLVKMQSEVLGSGALQREVLVGTDGSRFTRGAYDASLGACDPLLLAAPDDVRCVPRERAFHGEDSLFADAVCSTSAAYAARVAGECSAPKIVLRTSDEGPTCQIGGRPVNLFHAGEALATAYQHDEQGLCQSSEESALPQLSFYRVGTSRSADDLTRVHAAIVGSGRIRRFVWEAEQGKPLSPVLAEESNQPVLFDAQLGVRCEALRVGDEWLCAPPRALVSYANATCTTALLEVFEGGACPVETPTVYSVRGAISYQCGQAGPHQSISLLQPGAAVAAPAQRYVIFQGQCVPANSPAIKARYFMIGKQLPESTLARLQVARD